MLITQTMPQTRVIDYHGILRAMMELSKRHEFPAKAVWYGEDNNPHHQFVLELLQMMKESGLKLERIPELKAIASPDIAAVNRFLQIHGFDIRLPASIVGLGLALASVMKIDFTWHKAIIPDAHNSMILQPELNRLFESFELRCDGEHVKTFRILDNNHMDTGEILVRIETLEGHLVYLMPNQESFRADLAKILLGWSGYLKEEGMFEGIIIPKVQIDQQPDISKISGLSIPDKSGNHWRITYPQQQVRYRMDQKGGRLEAASAMIVFIGSPPEKLVLDQPFMFAFQPAKLSDRFDCPLTYGLISPDSWITAQNQQNVR